MAKYLKKFETTADYTAFIATDYVKPNVSYIVEWNGVEYNPIVPMNIITYEASAKLAETTSTGYTSGLHINSFSGASGQLTMASHTFENGVGTIKFNGDVINIGNYAFANCSGLTSIDIPSGVTSIGTGAFSYCSGLISITSLATTAPAVGGYTFQKIKTNGTLYVPNGSNGYDYWLIKLSSGWTMVEQ